MKVALVQTDILWNKSQQNFKSIEYLTKGTQADVFVLPEMFSSGFVTDTSLLPSTLGQDSLKFLQQLSIQKKALVIGSTAFYENKIWVNRCYFVENGAILNQYDKIHLFIGGEANAYQAGDKTPSIQYKNWNIQSFICFDLRFPTLAFQHPNTELLIYVANWPKTRSAHWKALLLARAIENQCYVIGLNRCGSDENQWEYQGDSMVIDPTGEVLVHTDDQEQVQVVTLSKELLTAYKEKFPFKIQCCNTSN